MKKLIALLMLIGLPAFSQTPTNMSGLEISNKNSPNKSVFAGPRVQSCATLTNQLLGSLCYQLSDKVLYVCTVLNANTSCTTWTPIGSMTVDPGDGYRGATFLNNTFNPSSPASGSTFLHAMSDGIHVLRYGDVSPGMLLTGSAANYTISAAGSSYYLSGMGVSSSGTDACALVQTAITASGTNPFYLSFQPGTSYNCSSTAKFNKNATGWQIVDFNGATIKILTSATAVFGANRTADYDTFNYIWIQNGTIDANNTGGTAPILFNGSLQRVNYANVIIENIVITNALTDYNQVTNNRGVVVLSSNHLNNSEATQTTIQNVTIDNIKTTGGDYGVAVVCGGPASSAASNVNCVIDNVTVTNIWQNMTPLQSQSFSGNCVQIGSRGKVKHTRVDNVYCEGSGDNAVEVNAAQNADISNVTCVNTASSCFTFINYSPPLDLNRQQYNVRSTNHVVTSAFTGMTCGSAPCNSITFNMQPSYGKDLGTVNIDGVNYNREDGWFGKILYFLYQDTGTYYGALRHLNARNLVGRFSNVTYSTAASAYQSWIYVLSQPYDLDGDGTRTDYNTVTLENVDLSWAVNRTGPNVANVYGVWVSPTNGLTDLKIRNLSCTVSSTGSYTAGERMACLETCDTGSNCTVRADVSNMKLIDAGGTLATTKNGVYGAFLGNTASATSDYTIANSDFTLAPSNGTAYDIWNYGSSVLFSVNNKWKNGAPSYGTNITNTAATSIRTATFQDATGNIALTNQGFAAFAGQAKGALAGCTSGTPCFIPANGINVTSTTESDSYAISPAVQIIARTLSCKLPSAVASGTYTFFFRSAGSDTALTCSITSSATACTDVAHTATVTAGSLMSFKVYGASTPTAEAYGLCTLTYSLE